MSGRFSPGRMSIMRVGEKFAAAAAAGSAAAPTMPPAAGLAGCSCEKPQCVAAARAIVERIVFKEFMSGDGSGLSFEDGDLDLEFEVDVVAAVAALQIAAGDP